MPEPTGPARDQAFDDPPGSGQAEGTIVRKTAGGYHVEVGEETLVCSLRSNLRKELNRPGDTTDHSGGFGKQVVREIGGKFLSVGDRVIVTRAEQGVGAIDKLLERRNVFLRRASGKRERNQVLVANLDVILIVFSLAEPDLRLSAVDRFLVAAESQDLATVLCLNKLDLVDEDEARELASIYNELAYPVILTSAQDRIGIDSVCELLDGRTVAMVGPSGVGKSSLANAIDPDLKLRTGEISRKYRRGAHITSDVSMLRIDLPGGGHGFLVDMPGIRELGLANLDPPELASYFREMEPLIGECKFSGRCLHTGEPGCAIIAAVEAGEIYEERYESYRKMLKYLQEQEKKW